MSSAQCLRYFINERLTAAAEEIFTEFERTIVQYEEEIDRQRRLLDVIWKPQITLQIPDFPQENVCKEEDVLADQQLFNQKENCSLNQEDPEPPQIKKGQETLCISLDQEDPEPPQIKECRSLCEESSGEILQSAAAEEIFTKAGKTIIQCEEDNDCQHFPQQHVCNKEDVLADQQLCNQERNSSLNQEDSEPPEIKEGQEEPCTSLEHDDPVLPQVKKRQKALCTSLDQEDPEPPQIKEDQEEPCTRLDQDDPKLPQVKQRQEALCTNLDQENPEPSQIKEVQKELCTTQEEEQLVQRKDTDTFALFQCKSICGERYGEILQSTAAEEIFIESEKTIIQCEEDNNHQHRLLNIIWKPEIKLYRIDFPQQDVCNKEEVLTDQQLCNQERNSNLNQEDSEPPEIKEGQEEPCASQEREKFVLRLETSEESDNSETEPSNDPFVFHSSTVAKSQIQKRKRHRDLTRNAQLKPKKRRLRERSHSNMEENCPMSEAHCDTGTETESKTVECDVCGKAFKYKSKMRSHRRSHTGEKPYACTTCGKKFTRMSSIKYHERIHTGEKPYACEICDKRFRGTVGLIAHTRTHSGEKLYSCKTCGRTFIQRGHLLRHKRIHTGEKPYSCETCGKNFLQCSHLLRHLRIHTGEKPYPCLTCGKSFNQSEILSVHMRTHTDQKPYICSMCGKEYKAASGLMRHRRAHTGERPYFCETCGRNFTQNEHLLRHMKLHKG